MAAVDKAANLGRSPPCDVCGHICHFAFVQHDATRSRAAAASAKRHISPSAPAGAPTIVCTRHVEALLQSAHADSGGDSGYSLREAPGPSLHLHMRYDDDELVQMATTAANAARTVVPHGTATLPKPFATAASLPHAVDQALKELGKKRPKRRASGGGVASAGMQAMI